jgi:hypothetical protein
VLLATTKRLLKANKGVLEISVFLRIWFKKKVYFLDRYATKVRFLQQISSSARILQWFVSTSRFKNPEYTRMKWWYKVEIPCSLASWKRYYDVAALVWLPDSV